MSKIILSIKNVSHSFGNKKILDNVSLELLQGSFLAVTGPSGAGKSTLFRAILGTDLTNEGSIQVDGINVIGPDRNVGIVYQQYTLAPFLTVEDNVALGLKLDQTSLPYRTFCFWNWWKLRQQHLIESRKILIQLGLEHAMDAYPEKLSGGMRQRAAIAQALIMRPKILLLDEPFGALDEATREDLQGMLLTLYQENISAKKAGLEPPHTVVMVTHELNEAFYIADRVVGISRFWKDEQGLTGLENGAKIMYDKAAPVFKPEDPRDFGRFLDLKNLLRKSVFDGELTNPNEHQTFWTDIEDGHTTGVSAIRS